MRSLRICCAFSVTFAASAARAQTSDPAAGVLRPVPLRVVGANHATAPRLGRGIYRTFQSE
jgi:hypothetical protein